MGILDDIQNKIQNAEPGQESLLYLLDFYTQAINTKDLDKTIHESLVLLDKILGFKNIVFYSMFQDKVEIHSSLRQVGREEINKDISKELIEELSIKEELIVDDKTFIATKINNQFLAFLVFQGKIINPQIIKVHNQFLANLIAKEKIISDLLEHSQRSTKLEENLNDTLSVVSHELRTPLANILGFSELMLNKPVSKEEGESFLKEIFNAGQRLGGIIDNFLDFAKIKNGNIVDRKNFSSVDIEDLCFKAWRYAAKPNNEVELAWLIDTDLKEVYCDEAAITRVMINLFTNAIKYSGREKTKIICEIKEISEKEILISVKDNGQGIEEEELSKIFDKFYRSKLASNSFITGSGLGLWICREIIQAHGGEIYCQSISNQGTEFSFNIRI